MYSSLFIFPCVGVRNRAHLQLPLCVYDEVVLEAKSSFDRPTQAPSRDQGECNSELSLQAVASTVCYPAWPTGVHAGAVKVRTTGCKAMIGLFLRHIADVFCGVSLVAAARAIGNESAHCGPEPQTGAYSPWRIGHQPIPRIERAYSPT